MLYNNRACQLANQKVPVLQQQICKNFLSQPNGSIVGTLQQLFTMDSQMMYKYASEAYKLFVTNNLCSADVWNKRYFEFATYGVAMSGLFLVYDIDKEEMKLHTSSFSILTNLASQGKLVAKKDTIAMELAGFKNVLVNSKKIADSIKTGGKFQAVRLDPIISGVNVKFTGQVPRSQLDLSKCLIIPLKAMDTCMKLLDDFLQSNLVEVAQGDKVRVITKNKAILSQVYGEARATQLLNYVYNPYINHFYMPSVGASSHTLGVTNIKLVDIDYIKPISLAQVDLTNINVDLTLARDFYETSVKKFKSAELNQLADFLQVSVVGDTATVLKEKCLEVSLLDARYYELMLANSNIFDIDKFKASPNKFGDLNESVPIPTTTQELNKLLSTGIFKIGITSKKGGMSVNVVTTNPYELKRIYGKNYAGKFESEGYCLRALRKLLDSYEGEEISIKDLEMIETRFKLGIGVDSPMSKASIYTMIDTRLDAVANRTTLVKSDTYLTVRSCHATVDKEGRSRDFYKQIDPSSIVAISRLCTSPPKRAKK